MSSRRLVVQTAFARLSVLVLVASASFMTGCAATATRAPTAFGAPRLDDAAAPEDGGVSAPVGEEKKSARKAIAAIERAIMKNDWATAKANADEAIAADPKSVRALYYAGLCAEKLGHAADAEALYRRSLAVDPTFPEAAINLSAALIEADKVKEAVTVILPAAKAWPADLLLQENLGLAAALGKSHETAIRAFQKLEKAGVLHTETRITYADSLLATGKRAEALTVLKAGLKQVADNEAEVVPYATLLLGAGSPEDAKVLVERVIKIAARSGSLHVLRGRAKLSLNDAQGAALDFEFALKLEPNDAAATFALAEARDVLGQRAEAKKAFTAALKLGLDGENAEKAKKRVEQISPLRRAPLRRIVPEQLPDRDLDRFERLGADRFAALRGERHQVAVGGPAVHRERVRATIDDPIVTDTRALVRAELSYGVVASTEGGDDLADPVGERGDGRVAGALRMTVAPPPDRIGTHEIAGGEKDVDFGAEPPRGVSAVGAAGSRAPQLRRTEQRGEGELRRAVVARRRRALDDFAIDELVETLMLRDREDVRERVELLPGAFHVGDREARGSRVKRVSALARAPAAARSPDHPRRASP